MLVIVMFFPSTIHPPAAAAAATANSLRLAYVPQHTMNAVT